MITDRLLEHAKKLEKIATRSASFASANPTDPWANIIARNHQSAAEDARHNYVSEQLERAGQMVDFRFFGPRADGSMPLDAFMKIFDPISRALKHAAQRIVTGVDAKKTDKNIGNYLNLKLAGLSYGSTRVFVSGSIVPDLGGTSVLEATLNETFDLLNASSDEFYDALDIVGGKSASVFLEALKAIDNAGFAAEFSWLSPSGKRIWNGTPNEILRLRSLLDGVGTPETYEETVLGFVSKISETGKIELRTLDDRFPVNFPLTLIDQVQKLTISSPAKLTVLTTRYYDNVKKKDVYKRNLTGVEG